MCREMSLVKVLFHIWLIACCSNIFIWTMSLGIAGDGKRKKDTRISAIRCEEYSEMTREVVWIKKIELMPMRLRCKKLINLLVVGGSLAEPKEYPHMVALAWTFNASRTEYFCAGSLISDRWILTAAHCVTGSRGPPSAALLGTKNLNEINNLNAGKLVSIKSMKTHPDYESSSLYADIALIELSEPVEFSSRIKPACLYSIPNSEPTSLWISGFGSSSTGQLSLTKAQLQIVEANHCNRIYQDVKLLPNGIDPKSQLCAGDKTGGWKKDTCAGDSGVPLQSTHPRGCLQEIVGLTSFGISCAVPGVPGVYTRVSYYVDWIESVVWPAANPQH